MNAFDVAVWFGICVVVALALPAAMYIFLLLKGQISWG